MLVTGDARLCQDRVALGCADPTDGPVSAYLRKLRARRASLRGPRAQEGGRRPRLFRCGRFVVAAAAAQQRRSNACETGAEQ